MYRNILNIARLFKNRVIYFPAFLDFRGRVYSLVNYLSYQGGDIARSLLNFHHVEPKKCLNDEYITIYLANVFHIGNAVTKNARTR